MASITEKDIDFNQLCKPWLDEIPVHLGYDKLVFNYETDENYKNDRPLERNIHFIWVGQLIKQKYINAALQCAYINKDYNVILWVEDSSINADITAMLNSYGIQCRNIYTDLDEDTNELGMYVLNQVNKNPNYAYKADIIRLYVVYKYGGIYSDIDSVWLKPLDQNFHYDFVCYRIDDECKDIGNPFFGFARGSHILLNILNQLEQSINTIMVAGNRRWNQDYIPLMTGGALIMRVLGETKPVGLNYIHQAYCVIGGPHERLYSAFSREGKAYCYQTFDKNWC